MDQNSETVRIRWTQPDERHMFTYSYSIVESILTCPVYGLVRYYNRKYYPTRRNMPLEAGSAMHDVFAAVRIWQLWRRQDLSRHAEVNAIRLFGAERHHAAWKRMDNERDELISYCYKILNSGEFYDDPDDRIRTLANMEETTIRYVDEMMQRMDDNPIWVADENDPNSLVGIEQHFDIIVEYKGRKLRYIGTIDGIVTQLKYPGTAMVDENKTASRLDEAWRQAYEVKSQPTGYTYVAKLMTQLDVHKVRMIGVKVKQARSYEDFLAFITERDDYQLVDWARSLLFTDDIVQAYGANPLEAPQFTHSCNRYFRACSFVDLCAATPEDRQDIYENSMVEAPLTPSQAALMGEPVEQ